MKLGDIDFNVVAEIRKKQMKRNLTSELSFEMKSESQSSLENNAPNLKEVSFYDKKKSMEYLNFNAKVIAPILKKV